MGERASAAAALVALIGAAGSALVGIALHLLAILAVTAGLLICVTGCWYAVSRRGLLRMISLLVVAFVAMYVVHDRKTKLDGSAKGGVAIPIAYELGLPVKLVGVGEQLEDLRPFDAQDYARALVD